MNKKMSDRTIAYYNSEAHAYADLTAHADMSPIYARFEKYLSPGAAVLDAGCGSGRDSLHFMKMGYTVTAIDASTEMCAYASELLQQEVRQLTFQELDCREAFSGIWACASLLHVPERQQTEVLRRLMRALTSGGVLYASWKYGETERTEAASGRLFCDMTEKRIEALAESVEGVRIEECWTSEDVRADQRSQKWMNGIFRKIK